MNKKKNYKQSHIIIELVKRDTRFNWTTDGVSVFSNETTTNITRFIFSYKNKPPNRRKSRVKSAIRFYRAKQQYYKRGTSFRNIRFFTPGRFSDGNT